MPDLEDDVILSSLVVAILRAHGISARLARGQDYCGVQVGTQSEVIVWSGSSGVWRWTAVHRKTGEVRVGSGTIGRDAAPETLAEMIALSSDFEISPDTL